MEDHEVRRFRAQMRLLQRRLRREVLPLHGLSRTAMQVLFALSRLPEGAQPRQVAGELQMTSSNVAAALRELERGGHVHRRRDEQDARRVRVTVTDDGRALVAGARAERDTWLGQAVEALLDPREQELLLAAGDLLERLAEQGPRQGPAPVVGAPGTGGAGEVS